jgi:hypothetical protein
MKMSVLDMVQDILNDLDLDEVNSIDDTVESAQVAQILRTTYFALMSNRNWAHQKQTITLNASNTHTRPTHMKVPENIKELMFVNYDCANAKDNRKIFKQLKWQEPDAFLRRQNNLNSADHTTIIVKDVTGVELLIQNNKAPEYFTTFDDSYIVCDSFDSSVENTLQETKVQAMAYMMPTWTQSDDFIPDLPEEAFIALLEEAKAKASYKLKQQLDQKAEQEAARQQVWLSRKNWQISGGIQYPNYGRGRSRFARDVTFTRGTN